MRIKRGFTLPILLLVVVASMVGVAGPASADGGDFSLDFIAAGPLSYNHETGAGGEYGARIIDKEHVVESLEGGDFECGDLVVYFTEITVDPGATDTQDIELDFSFLAEPTGQPGRGQTDLVSATPNDGDSANTAEADDTTVSIVSESLDTDPPPSKDTLFATVAIENLDPGEVFILRLTVLLSCILDSSPTGNLQADLVAGRVTAPTADDISGGAQTIPFKNINQVNQPGSVSVSVGECPKPGSPTVPVTVDISPEGSATVTIEGPGGPYVVTGGGDVLDLPPGDYTWSAEAEPGFDLTGKTSDEFTVQACPKTPASVEIEVGQCPEPGSPTVPVTVTIDPDEAASVTIEGPGGPYVVTETTELDLPPGNYTWTAEAQPTFELKVDSGEFTVQECPFLRSSVTIEVGECPAPGAATVPVTITIDPESSATVTIEGPGGPYVVTESGVIDLPSGSYTWTAEAAPTYELDVDAGEFTVPDCPEVLASVIVTVTPCPEGADSTGTEVTIDPAGAASVTITGDKGFQQVVTGSGATLDLVPDAYSWTATANPTYELIGATSGTFAIACVLAQTGGDVTDLGLYGLAAVLLGVGMIRFSNRRHVALATRLSGRSDWMVFFALALLAQPVRIRRRQHR